MFKDYYHILGVSPDADAEAIKLAFRQLAYQYHPDRNVDDKASHHKFILINEAYQVLADAAERRRFHHRYLLHYGKTKKVPPAQSSIELTRHKRASRYGRGHYAQRIRYRGTAYRQEGGGSRRRYRPSPAEEASRYVKWQEQLEAETRYYERYARWGRRVAMGVLLVLGLMMVDYYWPRQFEEQAVTEARLVPGGKQQARAFLIQTAGSRLRLSPRAAQFLEAGSVVSVERSGLAAVPAHVHAFARGYPRVFGIEGSPYGASFPFVAWALLGLCLATLYFRRNPAHNAYLGTFTAVAVVAALLGWGWA